MDKTRILEPLSDSISESRKLTLKQNLETVRTKLHHLSKREDFPSLSMSFEDFFVDCNLSLEEYLLTMRFSIKKPTVFSSVCRRKLE
jgi:hypothetical protein